MLLLLLVLLLLLGTQRMILHVQYCAKDLGTLDV